MTLLVAVQVSSDSAPCKVVLFQTKDGYVLRCTATLRVTSAKENALRVTTGRLRTDVITKEHRPAGRRNVTVIVSDKESELLKTVKEVFKKPNSGGQDKEDDMSVKGNGHRGDIPPPVPVESSEGKTRLLPIIVGKNKVDAPLTCIDEQGLDSNGNCVTPF